MALTIIGNGLTLGHNSYLHVVICRGLEFKWGIHKSRCIYM